MHRIAFAIALAATALGTAANQVNDQVTALTETQRQGIFARMLQRSGEKCPSVQRTFYQGDSKDGAAFWSVNCSGGKDWQVMIKGDGSTKVLECSVIKAMNGGKCFAKFK